MKHIILTLLIAIAGTLAACAQSALAIDKAFADYGHSRHCKMVEMHNATLRGYKLTTYKSLTYKTIGKQIEPLLAEDKKQAKKIREVVDQGVVKSGYYQMSPADNGDNRYILFSKGAKDSGTIIYIKGKLGPDDIMSLCYVRKK